jgi:hypothetical protein
MDSLAAQLERANAELRLRLEMATAGHHLPDHDRVTADQTYEVEALMAKHKKSQKQVLAAIEKAGPSRVQIERALRK